MCLLFLPLLEFSSSFLARTSPVLGSANSEIQQDSWCRQQDTLRQGRLRLQWMEEGGGHRSASGMAGCGLSVWAVAAGCTWGGFVGLKLGSLSCCSLLALSCCDLGVFSCLGLLKTKLSRTLFTVCARVHVFSFLWGKMPRSGLWASSRTEG